MPSLSLSKFNSFQGSQREKQFCGWKSSFSMSDEFEIYVLMKAWSILKVLNVMCLKSWLAKAHKINSFWKKYAWVREILGFFLSWIKSIFFWNYKKNLVLNIENLVLFHLFIA